MKDSSGRTIDYMRISITDRCNLRCRYCMPEGVTEEPRWEILSLEEIEAVALAGAGLGIKKIKVTGGEPLVRKNCPLLIKRLKAIPGIEKVTITTNGVLLEEQYDALLEAGVDGINVSLDTLNRRLYEKITGRDELERVLSGIKKAAEGPVPVKINAVSLDLTQIARECGLTGDFGWRELVNFARELPVDVRFIEMMPIGYGKQFETISHKTLLEEMKKEISGLCPDERIHGFGPAVYYKAPGFKGSIGLISAIHGKFCGDCNRVRLTAKGYLKSCLCYEDGVDLRAILRDGQEKPETDRHFHWEKQPDDALVQKALKEAMSHAVYAKPVAHCFENPENITEVHNMISIGG